MGKCISKYWCIFAEQIQRPLESVILHVSRFYWHCYFVSINFHFIAIRKLVFSKEESLCAAWYAVEGAHFDPREACMKLTCMNLELLT